MDQLNSIWWVCEHEGKGRQCLYADKGGGGPRCIKHGAILSPAQWLYGLSRKEAREKLDGYAKQGAR